MDLFSLRHAAKELLAAALLELFPTVQLAGGGVDETGFHYAFHFPGTFSKRELEHLEDQMIRIAHEARPIKRIEMMRENAATLLTHLGQPLRAQAALQAPYNILPLIQIGEFTDPSEGDFPETTAALKVFKLHRFETNGVVRIYGTAFEKRDQLKHYLKQCKEAAKRDPLVVGPREEIFLPMGDEWVYLERAEPYFRRLEEIWEEAHRDFPKISFPDHIERRALHEQVMEAKKWPRIASFSRFRGDLVSFQAKNAEELEQFRISSLQFIEKVFKISAFELNETDFRVRDGYGRARTLSMINVERKKNILHRSLFHTPKEWIAHMIEMGVKI